MDQEYFNSRYTFDIGRKKVWLAICEYLQEYIPATAAVLDLGAGYCDFINQIKAEKKYASDINPEVVKYCAQDVQFVQSNIASLNLPEKSINTIFASNLLEHLDNNALDAFFVQADKLLMPGGKIVLVQPNIRYCYREYWDDFTHVKAYSDVSLKDLLISRGYKIVKVEPKFIPFSFKSLLPKSYWLTKLYLMLPCRPLAKQMLIVAEK
jgi:SAM-dependent methyltransferase